MLKFFQSLINKHLNILYLDENAKEVFMPGPMVTFRSSRKLSIYLVRAKLYLLERVTGSCKCHGKRCAMCLNFNETSTFTSSVTHETYKINHKFDCNSKCLIYLSAWKKCSEQYVGQTIDVGQTISDFDGTTIKIIAENINTLKRVEKLAFCAVFIYLFIMCLFVACLYVCFLITLRELFVGSCIKYVV